MVYSIYYKFKSISFLPVPFFAVALHKFTQYCLFEQTIRYFREERIVWRVTSKKDFFLMHNEFFNNKKLDIQRLLDFGFLNIFGEYRYSVAIVDGQFTLVVTVSSEGTLHTTVIEVATNEAYVLHQVRGAVGAFVGRIRDEYASILAAIAEKCCIPDVFKSDYTKRVIEYVWNTYNDEPEYLWEKFPRNAVLRRKDNTKWYAVLLAVSARKIGLDDDSVVEIIDLRIDPKKIDSLVDRSRYFPGYHMNKKHWFTMCLDGSVPIEEIFQWIDSSYVLAQKRYLR